jgi:hypothetical protein
MVWPDFAVALREGRRNAARGGRRGEWGWPERAAGVGRGKGRRSEIAVLALALTGVELESEVTQGRGSLSRGIRKREQRIPKKSPPRKKTLFYKIINMKALHSQSTTPPQVPKQTY